MSLNIGLGDSQNAYPIPDEPSLSLDDDGYYWFLHSFFEDLANATGQYIDLYGDASFSGRNLELLEDTINRARNLIESNEPAWDVCTGKELVPHNKIERTRPHLKDKFARVTKARFLTLFDQWKMVIRRAKETARPVVCFGD